MSRFTGKHWLTSLFPIPPHGKEVKMYSFERPALLFWEGVAQKLRDKGFSDTEIENWLRSKEPRIFLDQFECQLEDFAGELAKQFIESE